MAGRPVQFEVVWTGPVASGSPSSFTGPGAGADDPLERGLDSRQLLHPRDDEPDQRRHRTDDHQPKESAASMSSGAACRRGVRARGARVEPIASVAVLPRASLHPRRRIHVVRPAPPAEDDAGPVTGPSSAAPLAPRFCDKMGESQPLLEDLITA